MDKSEDAFRTISEAAEELDLPQHVLRFWETRFPQIRPLKRGGGRRYYRPDDVELLRTIRHLLYNEGYTIKGVQRLLREGAGPDRGDEAPAAPHDDETEEAAEGELGLPEMPEGELERAVAEAGQTPEAPVVEPGDASAGSEVERLRSALRDALAALGDIRTMLGVSGSG